MCINRGMDKVDVVCIYIYTHSGILPAIKRNGILPFAEVWMDLVIQSKVSLKEKNIMY